VYCFELMHVVAKVVEVFPTANIQLVKQTMTNKLQDIAKMCKRKSTGAAAVEYKDILDS
jgi:hypothetical protein